MSRRLSDLHRTAFVTGAASGLGRAFAEMLTAEGVRVWGTTRDPGRLALAAPAAFIPVALDLADGPAAVAAFDRAAREAGGGFDLVINNAGYGVFGDFAGTEAAVWEAQLRSMLLTTLLLAHRAYAGLQSRGGGALVNVSSLAAEFPLPFMSGYNVAKAGLSALSASLIFESRGTPVRVLDFRPGDYRTAFNQSMQTVSPPLEPRRAAAWRTLEANLAAAPGPERAASDLRRALVRGRRGLVRSGSFFQATLAPLLSRLAPAALVNAVTARYFGCP